MPSPHLSIHLRIDQIREREIVVKTDDGQAWRLPRAAVHGTVTHGGDLRGLVFSSDADGMRESGLAEALLNELLHPPTS